MEDPPNGRVTSKEVYELLGRMEERLAARLDRLEDKLCEQLESVEDDCKKDIARVESRINRQDGLVAVAAAMAAAVSAAIGWNK